MRQPDQHDRAHARLLRALADAREQLFISPDPETTVLRTAADILAPDIETCPHPDEQRIPARTWSSLNLGYADEYIVCGRCHGELRDGLWALPREF